MPEEPIYTFIKGQGWVINPPLIYGYPYSFIDKRTDKSKPGVFTLEIWLVDLPHFSYRDWTDHIAGSAFSSEQSAIDYFTKVYDGDYHRGLCRDGMKVRIARLDWSAGRWWPAGDKIDANGNPINDEF